MVDFVIEVRANKNPPNAAIYAAAVVIIRNAPSQLFIGYVPEQLRASSPSLDEPRDERLILFAPEDRDFARIDCTCRL